MKKSFALLFSILMILGSISFLVSAQPDISKNRTEGRDIYHPLSTAPVVTSNYPLNGSTDIPVNIPYIYINFSKEMNETNLFSGFNITPYVAGVLALSGDNLTLTYNPNTDLSYATQYNITISGDVNDTENITLDGNFNGTSDGSPADDYKFNFTTEDLPVILDDDAIISPPVNNDNHTEGTTIYINESGTGDYLNGQVIGYSTYIYFVSNSTSTLINSTTDTLASDTYWFNNLTYVLPLVAANEVCYISAQVQLLSYNTIYGYSGNFTINNIPPVVTGNYPLNGSANIPVTLSTIYVNFSKPMNETILFSGFNITPYVEGELSLSPDGLNLTFTPDSNLSYDTQYNITISGDVNDTENCTLDGNYNGTSEGSPTDDYKFNFTTRVMPHPHILLLSPDGGESWKAGTDHNITWYAWNGTGTMTIDLYFSTNGVSGDYTLIASGEDNDGLYEWDVPDNASDDCYIMATVTDLNSQTETDYSNSSFTIIGLSPHVDYNYPLNHSTSVSFSLVSIYIIFSKEMNATSLLASFTMDPFVAGTLSVSDGNTTLTYTLVGYLEYLTVYTITISGDTKSHDNVTLDGNFNSTSEGSPEDDYIFTFTTQRAPPEEPEDNGTEENDTATTEGEGGEGMDITYMINSPWFIWFIVGVGLSIAGWFILNMRKLKLYGVIILVVGVMILLCVGTRFIGYYNRTL